MAMKFLFVLITIVTLFEESRALKVAIVGQGIAAASCATKLRELFGSDVDLTAFDAPPVGGRAHVIKLSDGTVHEAGASIIHERNLYLKRFLQATNLTGCTADGNSILAIFNGVEPVFVGSSNWLWNTARLFWRYNIDLLRIRRLVSTMLDDFDNIYRLQEQRESFVDLESMLTAWNKKFPPLLKVSMAEYLRQEGYSERFIDELVNAATRNNYNQRADKLHAFVGTVALAGFLPGLYSVKGGNFQIPLRIFESAGVKLYASKVTTIESTSDDPASPSFALHLEDGQQLFGFDFVVFTAPRYPNATSALPKFVNFVPHPPPLQSLPYQAVAASFVKGRLNQRYFHLPDEKAAYVVLTTGKAKTDPVSSVGASFPVDGCSAAEKNFTWKVFSSDDHALPEALLDKLFEDRRAVQAKLWAGAYPRYAVPQDISGGKFVLAPGLIVTSPIETLASALEMGAISGVNAALLIRNEKVREEGRRLAADLKDEL